MSAKVVSTAKPPLSKLFGKMGAPSYNDQGSFKGDIDLSNEPLLGDDASVIQKSKPLFKASYWHLIHIVLILVYSVALITVLSRESCHCKPMSRDTLINCELFNIFTPCVTSLT